MTTIQTTIAMFFTQNESRPFQASGPSWASAANVAGTRAAATARLT